MASKANHSMLSERPEDFRGVLKNENLKDIQELGRETEGTSKWPSIPLRDNYDQEDLHFSHSPSTASHGPLPLCFGLQINTLSSVDLTVGTRVGVGRV